MGTLTGKSSRDFVPEDQRVWIGPVDRRDLHDAQLVVISSDGWNHFKFDSM